MYFSTQGNWLYQQLIAFSFWQRIGLTIAITIIPLISWFFFLYRPITRHISEYQQQISLMARHEQSINSIQERCKKLAQEITFAEQQMNSHLILKKEAKHYLPLLVNQAKECGVCLDAGSIDPSADNNSYHITAEGHGTLTQLTNLLCTSCERNPLLAFEQITINLIKNNIYHATIKMCHR